MNFIKKVFRRAFTSDGGSIIKIRNEFGELDLIAAVASLVRSLTALIVAAAAILIADALGVEVSVVTDAAAKIKELLS